MKRGDDPVSGDYHCNQKCNQGRECDCGEPNWKELAGAAIVIVAIVALVGLSILSGGFVVWEMVGVAK